MSRPVKYSTVEEMQEAIDHYFDIEAYMGEGDNRIFAPTVEGLAYALDLTRQGLIEYQDKPEFSDTIKRAKQRVAIALEQRLYGQSVTGAIFNLKNNFGWKDAVQTEHTGSIQIEAIERRIVKTGQ